MRVAAFQAQTMAGCTGSPVTSLPTRGLSDAGGSRGSRLRGITRPGPAGLLRLGCQSSAPQTSRDAARMHPASHGISPKPRSAGETPERSALPTKSSSGAFREKGGHESYARMAGASPHLRSTRVEANASPAPLHCHHPRRPWRSGASTCQKQEDLRICIRRPVGRSSRKFWGRQAGVKLSATPFIQ